MAKAPLPEIFPGKFFVLVWNRDREAFSLELDDGAHSSYDLGHEPLGVVAQLKLRGFNKWFREQAVDVAREFGIAQCIPGENRVLPILPRSAPPPVLKFYEEPTHAWIPSLY